MTLRSQGPTVPTRPTHAPSAHHGIDRVHAIVRDPEHAVVYWTLTAARIARARAQLARWTRTPQLTLRVYTHPATPRRSGHRVAARVRDLPLERWVGQRTIALDTQHALRTCVIGLCATPARTSPFVALARSAPFLPPPVLGLPREHPAPVVWVTPRALQPR